MREHNAGHINIIQPYVRSERHGQTGRGTQREAATRPGPRQTHVHMQPGGVACCLVDYLPYISAAAQRIVTGLATYLYISLCIRYVPWRRGSLYRYRLRPHLSVNSIIVNKPSNRTLPGPAQACTSTMAYFRWYHDRGKRVGVFPSKTHRPSPALVSACPCPARVWSCPRGWRSRKSSARMRARLGACFFRLHVVVVGGCGSLAMEQTSKSRQSTRKRSSQHGLSATDR